MLIDFAVLMREAGANADQRLRAVEARSALVERLAGIGTWRMTEDFADVHWSPGLYRILGIDPAVTAGADLFQSLHSEEDRNAIGTALASVRSAPGPFYFQHRIVRPDGSERCLESSGDAETGPDGALIAYVGVTVDITKRVQAEEAQRLATDAFRALTEEANDVIGRHSPDGAILYISPAVTRTLGYDPIAMLGRNYADFCHPDDVSELMRVRRALMRIGASIAFSYRMRHAEGHYIWVETVARAAGEPGQNRIKEIFTVSRDVTARKEAEIEVDRARVAAESANRMKSRFLATMSHELRTPLNAIIGFSDLLKSELFGPLGPKYQEYAGLIHESGAHLLDLINDILDMSKIEAGKYELAREVFEPSEILGGVMRMLRQKTDAAGLNVVIDGGGDPSLDADKRAVKQIVLNLVANAIKFTPQGGTITLLARRMDGMVALSVADTGAGIPEADLPRLGRPFEQAKQDTKSAQSGTGLGLALVRAFAELHGGEMRIESTVGKGTCVTVILPAAAGAASAAA